MATKARRQGVDRLDQVVQMLAEGQLSLQKLIADLATETRRGFDRVAKQFAETNKHSRETDERIDKLVVAIGEFIRRQNGHPR